METSTFESSTMDFFTTLASIVVDSSESAAAGSAPILPQKNETKAMRAQLAAYDVMIPLLGAIIVATNLAVVISSGLILKKGQQPRCTYLLLGNVAMADLVTGIAVLFGQVFPKEHRNQGICSLQIGMIVSSTVASIYSVALIAVDRFLYILHGLKYRRWVYPTRARCLIAITWILGLIIGFLPAMGWSGNTNNGKICWFIMLAPPKLIVLTTIVGITPVLLVCVLYSIILYHAIKKVIQLRKMDKGKETNENNDDPTKMRVFRGGRPSKTIATIEEEIQKNTVEEKEPERHQTRVEKMFNRFKKEKPKSAEVATNNAETGSPKKWKAVKVVLFTTGSFVCTWVPYFIACTCYVYCDYKATPGRCQRIKFAIASPLAILGFVNSLLNPVIYAWWHNGFRNSVKKLCCAKKSERFQPRDQRARPGDGSKTSQSSGQTFTPMISSSSMH